MKLRLLEYLRCPTCRADLRLEAPTLSQIDRPRWTGASLCTGLCPFPEITGRARNCSNCSSYEVTSGRLACRGCGGQYDIQEGIPFLLDGREGSSSSRDRTAERFGYLWTRETQPPPPASTAPDETTVHPRYHAVRMERALGLAPADGLVLDAGCGSGVDLVQQVHQTKREVIGVDLSRGGCQASYRWTLANPCAHVVQADLSKLPFKNDCFHFIYSYGVLHHMSHPNEGFKEMVRVLRPGASVAVYLYEDFSERSFAWRWMLQLANRFRSLTTRIPHRFLYRLCQITSPLVYLSLAVPHRILRHIPGLKSFAESLPYRHALGPFSLAGDLYDRFSTPVEWRFSRSQAKTLLTDQGLENISLVQERGWMASGSKPASQ